MDNPGLQNLYLLASRRFSCDIYRGKSSRGHDTKTLRPVRECRFDLYGGSLTHSALILRIITSSLFFRIIEQGVRMQASLGILGYAIIALVLSLWIWAVVDLLKRDLSGANLTKWLMIVIIFPVVGFILYFSLGRKNRVF